MKKIFTLLTIFSLAFTFNSCDEEIETSSLKYASFEKTDVIIGVADSSQSIAEFDIYTTNKSSSPRTFDIQILESSTADADFYNVPATVTIPGGSNKGTISVELNDGAWLDMDKMLSLKLSSSINNQYTGSESLDISIYRLCPGATDTKVSLSVTLDDYPEEVAWRIVDTVSGNTFIASATPFAYGAYTGLASGSVQVLNFCLPSGSYVFQIFDGYADGAGPYNLKIINGAEILSGDGAYAAGETIPFTL